MKDEMKRAMEESTEEFTPFTIEELLEAMKHFKPGKAAGFDDITAEVILHFGNKAKLWILALFNNCARTFVIPRLWRRAKLWLY